MALKPVNFDDYLKWFDEHKVVVKAQTANGVEFKTTIATAKKLLEKVKSASTTVEAPKNHLTVVNNYFGKDAKSSQQESKAYIPEQSVNVSLEWENEVEEEILESEWEKVVVGGNEDVDEWDIV